MTIPVKEKFKKLKDEYDELIKLERSLRDDMQLVCYLTLRKAAKKLHPHARIPIIPPETPLNFERWIDPEYVFEIQEPIWEKWDILQLALNKHKYRLHDNLVELANSCPVAPGTARVFAAFAEEWRAPNRAEAYAQDAEAFLRSSGLQTTTWIRSETDWRKPLQHTVSSRTFVVYAFVESDLDIDILHWRRNSLAPTAGAPPRNNELILH